VSDAKVEPSKENGNPRGSIIEREEVKSIVVTDRRKGSHNIREENTPGYLFEGVPVQGTVNVIKIHDAMNAMNATNATPQ